VVRVGCHAFDSEVLSLGSPDRTRVWLGLFVIAQFTDLLTTLMSLRFGGREANPLVSGIIAAGGLGRFTLFKLLGVVAVVLLIICADGLRRRLPARFSNRTAPVLTFGLQLGVAILLLAAAQNVAVVGTILAAGPIFS
jgi:hypothetical protein